MTQILLISFNKTLIKLRLNQKMVDHIDKLERDFYSYIASLSKHKIEDVSKKINQIKRQKYPDKKENLYYGNSRSIDESTFLKIISCELNKRANLAYRIMFYMGLRVSEVAILKVSDINPVTKVLTINNVKCKRKDFLRIPDKLYSYLESFLASNLSSIFEKESYLIYSNNKSSKNNHLSKDWLRNNFRKLSSEYNKVYAKTSDGRKLNQISSHSLRRSHARRVYNVSGNDIEMCRAALRHKDIKVTQSYIHTSSEQLFNLLKTL